MLQASGVGVNQACLSEFNDLKMSKKLSFITFGLSKDLTEVVVLTKSESRDYSDFVAELPENECRWAVYDLEYEADGGGKRNKLVFFHWYAVVSNSSCIYALTILSHF